MSASISDLVDTYFAWLRQRTNVREIGQWSEITTPFLDRHNDAIQIYVRRHNGEIILTDDGYTLSDLEQSGVSFNPAKRQQLLKTALSGFGIKLDGDALTARASDRDFGVKKHNLIQAILAVNDLFYLSGPHTANFFFEDVAAWLDQSDIRYTENVKFAGQSGYDHLFGFLIPRSREAPERIMRAITNPTRTQAQNFAFAWTDIRNNRPPQARALAILNDERQVSDQVIEALEAYSVQPVLWSQRNEIRPALLA